VVSCVFQYGYLRLPELTSFITLADGSGASTPGAVYPNSVDCLPANGASYIDNPTNMDNAVENVILWTHKVLDGLEQIRWKPIGTDVYTRQPLYTIHNPQEAIDGIMTQYATVMKRSLQVLASIADASPSPSENFVIPTNQHQAFTNMNTSAVHNIPALQLTRGITAEAFDLLDSDIFSKWPGLIPASGRLTDRLTDRTSNMPTDKRLESNSTSSSGDRDALSIPILNRSSSATQNIDPSNLFRVDDGPSMPLPPTLANLNMQSHGGGGGGGKTPKSLRSGKNPLRKNMSSGSFNGSDILEGKRLHGS
jgi:hypothetical protein